MRWVYYIVQATIIGGVFFLAVNDHMDGRAAAWGGICLAAIVTAIIYWSIEGMKVLLGRLTGHPYRLSPLADKEPRGLGRFFGPRRVLSEAPEDLDRRRIGKDPG